MALSYDQSADLRECIRLEPQCRENMNPTHDETIPGDGDKSFVISVIEYR
jgi:hypothetical protein